MTSSRGIQSLSHYLDLNTGPFPIPIATRKSLIADEPAEILRGQVSVSPDSFSFFLPLSSMASAVLDSSA